MFVPQLVIVPQLYAASQPQLHASSATTHIASLPQLTLHRRCHNSVQRQYSTTTHAWLQQCHASSLHASSPHIPAPRSTTPCVITATCTSAATCSHSSMYQRCTVPCTKPEQHAPYHNSMPCRDHNSMYQRCHSSINHNSMPCRDHSSLYQRCHSSMHATRCHNSHALNASSTPDTIVATTRMPDVHHRYNISRHHRCHNSHAQ